MSQDFVPSDYRAQVGTGLRYIRERYTAMMRLRYKAGAQFAIASGYRRIGHFGLHWYKPTNVGFAGLELMRGGERDRIIGITGGVRGLGFAVYWLCPVWYASDRMAEAQRALKRARARLDACAS